MIDRYEMFEGMDDEDHYCDYRSASDGNWCKYEDVEKLIKYYEAKIHLCYKCLLKNEKFKLAECVSYKPNTEKVCENYIYEGDKK